MKLVVKLGGTLLDNEESRSRLAKEIAAAAELHQVVVVHGGGKQMTRFLEERGVQSQFINGLRVTSPEIIDAVVKVFSGSVNAQLVTAFRRTNAKPVGLSGFSASLVDAVQLDPQLGQVGKPVACNAGLLNLLVNHGYLPVVACVAGDEGGNIFNVNGDQMAVACAAGFAADALIFLTDVEGVRDATGQRQALLTRSQARQLIAEGTATGGMQAKLESAMKALEENISEVIIAPGADAGIVEKILARRTAGTRLISD